VALHRRYSDALTQLGALTDSRTTMPALMPHEHVWDFFYRNQNYFGVLDQAAEQLATAVGTRRGQVRQRLRTYLEETHDIRVVLDGSHDANETYSFNADDRVLTLGSDLRAGQQAFRMATQLAYLEASELIDGVLDAESWPDETTRKLARIGLAQHFAGAFVLPYGPFFTAAERFRYDIEILKDYFGVGYETLAHRLSTLQRPGRRGVPFIFVRADKAGNISQRQSATSFHFSRSGGTCPLWNMYDAFAAPGRINVQVAEMPDGQRYLWIARTVTRHRGGYGNIAKTFVIGLGCELRQAGRLVYSDGIDLAHPRVVPIGPGCRTCERPRCAQRAAPPIGRAFVVDEARESFAPYPLQPRELRRSDLS
jgi:predicted transcriptional regulator